MQSSFFHLVPGPVTGLNFTKISTSIIQVVWNRPQITNGIIVSYSVIIKTNIETVFQRTVLGDQNNVLVTNLGEQSHLTVAV